MSLINQIKEKGLIEKDQARSLQKRVEESDLKEEEVILEKKIVPESFLFKLKSEYLNIPLKENIPDEISQDILEIIPQETVKHYKMGPIEKKNEIIHVGMIYPQDYKAKEALKFLSRQKKFDYKIFLITPTSFEAIVDQYKSFGREIGRALGKLEKTEKVSLKEPGKAKNKKEIQKMAEEAPISKMVGVILKHAVEGNASDIHIEPTKNKLRIRFRMMGELYSSLFLPLKIHSAVVARIKILSDLKIDKTRVPQDGRFSAEINGRELDLRVSTLPTTLGEKVALRVLNPEEGLKKFEELGLEGDNLDRVKEITKAPYGLVLATGPTSAGKTTTLYSILHLLNKENVNIITLEDPVEYFMAGANQSQVKPEIGYTFSQGLRHILRQDPDIIMVGEIRDEETAALAIHAALTGHIVLSTLHTNNALGIIPRLIDMGVAPYLIPPTLRLGIAQRLVRQLCPHCRREIEPTSRIKNMIRKELEKLPNSVKRKRLKNSDIEQIKIYKAVGCEKCNQSGYTERIGIFETLTMNDELAEIIAKEPSENEIKEIIQEKGMITMKQDGILKVLNGITTIEEVIKVTGI